MLKLIFKVLFLWAFLIFDCGDDRSEPGYEQKFVVQFDQFQFCLMVFCRRGVGEHSHEFRSGPGDPIDGAEIVASVVFLFEHKPGCLDEFAKLCAGESAQMAIVLEEEAIFEFRVYSVFAEEADIAFEAAVVAAWKNVEHFG